MILLVHMLLGAAIGNLGINPVLAVILAFLSHYLLDFIPHIEYSIKNIKNKNWSKAHWEFIKVFIDFLSAIALILFFSKNQPIIYICALAAIIPDGLSILNYILKLKILNKHSYIHQEKIHFLKNKKISKFWRISSQILVVIVCLIFLKF